MSIGLDLALIPIDAVTGQTRFGPSVAYALAASEVVDLALAERIALRDDRLAVLHDEPIGDPLLDDALVRLQEPSQHPTVSEWVAQRGPWRIDAYIHEWERIGTLLLVPIDPPTRGVKRIEVRDPQRIRFAVDRLTSAIAAGDASPYEDQAFAALVTVIGCPRPLNDWRHRSDRKRLRSLSRAACRDRDDDATARAVLREALRAVRHHAKYAGGSTRTIDEQIGLTKNGWWASGRF